MHSHPRSSLSLYLDDKDFRRGIKTKEGNSTFTAIISKISDRRVNQERRINGTRREEAGQKFTAALSLSLSFFRCYITFCRTKKRRTLSYISKIPASPSGKSKEMDRERGTFPLTIIHHPNPQKCQIFSLIQRSTSIETMRKVKK